MPAGGGREKALRDTQDASSSAPVLRPALLGTYETPRRCWHCADDHCSAREVGVLPARRTVLFVVLRVRAGGIGRLGSLALLVLRTLVVVGAGLPGEQPGSSTHRGRGP